MTTPIATPDGIAGAIGGMGRVDAREKVLGAPIYAADRLSADMAFATVVTATIGKGRIERIDRAPAEGVAGVQLIWTHEDVPPLQSGGFLLGGGYGFQSLQVLTNAEITYQGQIVALVVADTLEAAIEAGQRLAIVYAPAEAAVMLDAEGAEVVNQPQVVPMPAFADKVLGDAEHALAEATVQVDAVYESPAQHPNPMELIATVAEWQGNRLIVHEGSQNTGAIKHGLATQLAIDPAQIDVISPYLGGGFGQKNSLQATTALAASASRELQRPVKLVATRSQLFHNASFRPASRHHIRLGGDRSGRLTAFLHDVDQQTSRYDHFPASYTELTTALYGWQHVLGRQRLVRLDTQTPGYMRAPFEHAAAFALESAVDEYAVAIGVDPVEVRLINDTVNEPVSGLPFTSRHAAECLQRGAEQFGWAEGPGIPGSRFADDGSLVGWGVALGAYKASTAPAVARVRLAADGTVAVAVAGHEMGQGLRSAIASLVAEILSVPSAAITINVGDTRAVVQHLTAGSWGTATAVPAVRQALDDLLSQVAAMDNDPAQARAPHAVIAAAGQDAIEVEVRHRAPGQPEDIYGRLNQGLPAAVGPHYPEFVAFSYIAHFAEVHVEPTTGRVRVPRVVSVVDCGKVMNPVTAASQVRGGVVWGIGAALRERSEIDPHFGGFLNADIAEYLVPVNADIGEISVDFIDQPDPLLNRDGVKSLGEVVMVGVAPAIANAIFSATGKRFRHLPIRLEDLLGPG